MYTSLINTLDSAEKNEFILFLKKRNKRKDIKNIRFFKADKDQLLVLKEEIGVNAFNVLKSRLTTSLISFIGRSEVAKNLEVELEAIQVLAVSRRLFEHNTYKEAFKLLKKSEVLAANKYQYAILNEIYKTAVEYSYHEESEDTEVLLTRIRNNYTSQLSQYKLDLLYSEIKKAFNQSEFKNERINVNDVIVDAYQRLNINIDLIKNIRNIHNILTILDIQGGSSKNYSSLDMFVLDNFDYKSQTIEYIQQNSILFIDSLYLLSNIYFRQLNFEQSLEIIKHIRTIQLQVINITELQESKLSLLEALNYNFLGKQEESVAILEKIIECKSEIILNIQLALAMVYFQQNKIKKAKNIIRNFNRSDQYYIQTIGKEWTLNKNYIEILVALENEDYEYCHNLLNNFKRKFKKDIHLGIDARMGEYINIINSFIINPTAIKDEDFISKVYSKLIDYESDTEDIFNICFFSWIESKITNQSLFITTLAIINRKRSTIADL